MEVPTGYCQINILWTGGALPTGAETTFGIDNTADDRDPADVALAVVEAFNATDILQFFSSGISGATVLCKNGPTATGPSGSAGVIGPGSGSSATVPPNVSVLVQKHTAFGGRAGRGRMYFPGWPEANLGSDGVLGEPTRTNFEAEFTTTMALLDVGSLPQVVLHGAGSPLSTPSPVTSYTVATSAATQRRRLRR